MRGKLYGVGVGPGNPELLTIKAARIIGACEVLACSGKNKDESLALNIVKAAKLNIDKETLMFTTPMSKDFQVLNANYMECAKKIEEVLNSGKNVALLTLGDTTVYSACMYILQYVKGDGYETEIVSGVTSFSAAAAKCQMSLCEREEELHIIPASYDIEKAVKLNGNKILMKAGRRISEVKETLLRLDISEAVMVENCGIEDEHIYYGTKNIPDEAGYYSIIIIKDAVKNKKISPETGCE